MSSAIVPLAAKRRLIPNLDDVLLALSNDYFYIYIILLNRKLVLNFGNDQHNPERQSYLYRHVILFLSGFHDRHNH